MQSRVLPLSASAQRNLWLNAQQQAKSAQQRAKESQQQAENAQQRHERMAQRYVLSVSIPMWSLELRIAVRSKPDAHVEE